MGPFRRVQTSREVKNLPGVQGYGDDGCSRGETEGHKARKGVDLKEFPRSSRRSKYPGGV